CRTEVVARAQGAAHPSAGAAPGDRAANIADFRASCGRDVQTLCAGVPKKGRGVVKCLVSHRTELSATCLGYLKKVWAQRRSQKNGPSSNLAAPESPAPPAAGPPDKQ